MDIISLIVLILFSLASYSAGAVRKAGKFVELKPQILDLTLVAVIWAGAIYSRTIFDINRWLLILIWAVISIMIGALTVLLRNIPITKDLKDEQSKKTSKNFLKKAWKRWKEFSKRMGSFQSRVILSLFFFLLASPFALAVKIFFDPLKIKPRGEKSYWHPKKEVAADPGLFRRQF